MSKSNWLKDEDQKGNFSNEKEDTFDPQKGYVGIRLQQGVPLLDRDWNESEDMRRYAEVMLRKYYIGNGVPDENSFKISAVDPPANDFKIAAGRCLVEGFEVVNEPVDADGKPLDFILYSQQEGVAPLSVPEADRYDTVYLDVWVREVTSAKDTDLNNSQDVDMETCIRHKLEWRVKVAPGGSYSREEYHYYYEIANIRWGGTTTTKLDTKIEDKRVIGLSLHRLADHSNADDRHKHSRLSAPDGSPDPALIVDNTGNVGIGTTSPKSHLSVVNESETETGSINEVRIVSGRDRTGHVSGIGFSTMGRGSDQVTGYKFTKSAIYHIQTQIGYWGIGDLAFAVSNNVSPSDVSPADEKMRITKDGNVGIGTTNPMSVINNGSLKHSLETTGWILARGSGENTWGDRATRIGVMKGGGSERDTWWISANPNNKFAIHQGLVGDRLTIDSYGNVGIGTTSPGATLDVDGNIRGKSFCNVCESFFVGGDVDKFYAVAFHNGDWGQGPAEFEIVRSNIHEDGQWWGSMNLTINWHPYNWGQQANFLDQKYHYGARTFVKDIIEYPYRPWLLIWLRGNTTYYYRSLNNRVVLWEILGTDNQTCSFDRIPPGYVEFNTAIDATYRPEQADGIKAGTTVDGDFYATGNIYTNNQLVPVGSSDYAEYFESKDGKEIEAGISVILDKGKIRPAKKNEIPLGIISANPGMAGGVHVEWPKKYLRDEFGNQIMEEYKEEIMSPKKEKVKKERQKIKKKKVKEEVKRTEVVKVKGKYCQKEITETVEREVDEPVFKEVDLYDTKGKEKIGKHKIPVMETYEEEIDVPDENGQPVMKGSGKFETRTRPKLNPDYDEKREYIPREKRPEWNCVGLLGQLPLRKGQPTAPTWVKIKDISKDVELWLVK